MSVPWPSTLQLFFNEDSFSTKYPDTVIRSDMDVGPAKLRRRFTKNIEPFSASINLTVAQYSTFKTFYDTTTNGGITPFLYNHPITQVESEFRFVGTPDITSLGGGNFRAVINLEILP